MGLPAIVIAFLLAAESVKREQATISPICADGMLGIFLPVDKKQRVEGLVSARATH